MRNDRAHDDASIARGWQYFQAGLLDRSRQEFSGALGGPRAADGRYGLGLVARKLGDRATAWREFHDALTLNPSHVNALLQVGVLLEEQGQATQAGHVYRRILATDSRCDAARLATQRLQASTPSRSRGTSSGTGTGLVGYATHVRYRAEASQDGIFGGIVASMYKPQEYVLTFRVEADGGLVVAVEMRGLRITGTLDEGDRVAIPGPIRPGRLVCPNLVTNLSTNAPVEASGFAPAARVGRRAYAAFSVTGFLAVVVLIVAVLGVM